MIKAFLTMVCLMCVCKDDEYELTLLSWQSKKAASKRALGKLIPKALHSGLRKKSAEKEEVVHEIIHNVQQ